MGKIFKVRKPRLRIGKSGKISLSGGGVRLGGRRSGINVSKTGVSSTIGSKLGSYNTRRGCSLPCLPSLLMIFIGFAATIIGIAKLVITLV